MDKVGSPGKPGLDVVYYEDMEFQKEVYDKTTPEGIVYAASVCYPQTDLYVPLSITVTADGKMSIKKVDMLEDDYTEETPE